MVRPWKIFLGVLAKDEGKDKKKKIMVTIQALPF